ncbi:MAG: DegT/DnrJ/EryC1/StrS family aminotransferase [Nitrospirae bacterium]|nr:DegT/DnrJ/EryC1/StrS family aminotransferase [Nitrospirota bacterium]
MAGIIRASAYIGGAAVRRFEEAFAAYCGVKHGVGVGSGTAALTLGLKALGLRPGEGVLVPSFTFVATAHSVIEAGGRPVFVDVDPFRFTLDPEACERALKREKGIRFIIPVHLYGQMADMDAVSALARRYKLTIFEDAAQAHGARFRGRRAGSFGAAAAFSFYPSKNLGAYGDGGILVTNDARVADKVVRLRDQGRPREGRSKYLHPGVGGNHRLDGLQAAILNVKLAHLDEWNERRRTAASLYTRLLEGHERIRVPSIAPHSQHVFHIYAVHVRHRDKVLERLRAEGVSADVHYPIPLHMQPSMRFLGHRKGDFPVSELLARTCLSLPLYPELRPSQIRRVVRALDASVRGA